LKNSKTGLIKELSFLFLFLRSMVKLQQIEDS